MNLTSHRPEPQIPSRVVVLGARGFLGSHLTQRLHKAKVATLPLTSAELDLGHEAAAERLASLLEPDDALVFLSALTPDKGRDIATMMRNLAMGRQVCAALARQPCAHVVYASSDAVYPFTEALISETSPAAPTDLYGAMHLTREIMLRSEVRAPLAILRLTAVYGSGDTHNGYGPNRFARLAQAGERIGLFGEGEETRDHLFIDDAVELMWHVLTHRSAGLLNVASGTSHSFHDVAKAVASHREGRVTIAGSPRANPITHRHFDITATIKTFPQMRFTPLREGLARMAVATQLPGAGAPSHG